MQTCPSRDKLEGMLTARLSDLDLRTVESHVKGCRHCQQTLDIVAAKVQAMVDGLGPKPA